VRPAPLVLGQVDQVARLEIVQVEIVVVLADRVQADQVAQVVLVVKADQVAQVQIVQVAIVVVLVDLVRQALVAVSLVREHQVQLRVAHQVADQVAGRIQPAAVETQLVRLVNLAVGLRRVASQSGQSVKSSTT
jgi:hypothetical protein